MHKGPSVTSGGGQRVLAWAGAAQAQPWEESGGRCLMFATFLVFLSGACTLAASILGIEAQEGPLSLWDGSP